MANRSGMAAVYGALGVDVTRDIVLTDTVVAANLWTETSGEVDFPWQAIIPDERITAKMKLEVILGMEDASGGNFAPVAETIDGGIKIFAVSPPESAITIPTILIWK